MTQKLSPSRGTMRQANLENYIFVTHTLLTSWMQWTLGLNQDTSILMDSFSPI
jgi:hypothetical protein